MFNNFVIILHIFVVFSLNIQEFASESGTNEIPEVSLGLALRQERVDAYACEEEKSYDGDEEWDLCFTDSLISTNSQTLSEKPHKESHCMCDNECNIYGDCCADKIEELIPITSKPCIQLFSESLAMTAVYGIDRCDNNWKETDEGFGVKQKCEFNAFEYNSSSEYYSYLQDIPVMSNSTNIMYKNIFCAVCNRDASHLKTWNMSVICSGFQIDDRLKHKRNDLRSESYDSLKKRWKTYDNNNELIFCSIAVQQFKDEDFIEENNLRKCKKTIDNCPHNWTDISVDQKCKSYSSYVFADNKAYKNYHCALCNGVDMGYISCFPNATGFQRDLSKSTLWFPLLLDFNFSGDKGEWIGGRQKCPERDQLYDSLYDKCVSIHCNQNTSGNGCHFSDSLKDSFDLNCSAVLVLEEGIDFNVFNNNSIYINKTKTFLNESDYKLYKDSNGLKLKICRNESQLISDSLIQSPFDVSFGQIILSEISLYTSIVCLALHLSIYTLLPKLRNLPGKNLMSLSGALLLGHISFATASHLVADRKIVCVLMAIITHYSYLSAFFWMSVLAFDICKTFRRTSRRSKSSKRYKYLKYSLYAWLTPAFIVLLSTAFDIGLKESKFQPLYGLRFCWISQRQALLVFFALPVAIIICINLFLFGLTAKGLIKTEEQTKILKKKSDKVRYVLYIKLAVIMGLNWTFGFVASLTDWKVLWYPFIVLNGLQGAIIFIAFTCKRKVWKLLAEKFGFKGGYERSTTTSDVIRSGTGSSSLQSSTIVPNSPNTNVTKINV